MDGPLSRGAPSSMKRGSRSCQKSASDRATRDAARKRNICHVCRPLGMGRCPIGEEWLCWPGYYVIGHSIQVMDTARSGRCRWVVAVFFSGRRADLRFPVGVFARKNEALKCAFDYGRHYVGGGVVDQWCPGDWIARGPRGNIIILVVDR